MKDLDKFDNWESVHLETCKFLLDQSEKMVLQTVETARILTERATTLLTFGVPFMVALIGLMFSSEIQPLHRELCLIALVSTIYLTWRALKVYRLYEVMTVGNVPANLLIEANLAFEGDDQLKATIMSVLQQNQQAVEFNTNENKKRSLIMYSIIKWAGISGGVIILYGMIRYFFTGAGLPVLT